MSNEEGLEACAAMLEKVERFPNRHSEYPECETVLKRLQKSMKRSGRCTPTQQREIRELSDLTEKWVD